MRYRPLDADGDYTIGKPFLVDSPQCVAQALLTRLRLWRGEFFLDTTDGTPYLTDVLGKRTGNPDAAIKQRILGTPNVTAITSYSSGFDGDSRVFTVSCTISTAFGETTVTTTL